MQLLYDYGGSGWLRRWQERARNLLLGVGTEVEQGKKVRGNGGEMSECVS